jgi:hypothetical protein
MSEVAKTEGHVRYSSLKKKVKVMITPTDSLDDLKAQLNTYFEHFGENQYTCHLFGQMPCIDLEKIELNTHGKRQDICLGLLKTIATSDLCFGIWWKIIYYVSMFVPYAIVLNVRRDLI